MSDNWSVIKAEVHTYRDYVHKLPPKAKEKASFCYLLKKEEFHRLMNLKGDGTTLDGVRIYLGGEMIEGHLVPTIHIVACEKDGQQYNDYGVPTDMPAVALAAETGIKPLAFSADAATTDSSKGTTGGTFPCPAICSGQNILNS